MPLTAIAAAVGCCVQSVRNAIRAFAGNEVLKAKYYTEDKDFLLEFEDEVQHYVVVARASED